VRHVIYKVSSFSFWTGDFTNFIGMLPVEKNDVLLFNFGTFDFRRGCFKLAEKRKIPVEEIVYQTVFQTFYKLKQLRSIYPDNHFIVSSIVPPIREVFFNEEERKDYLWNSDDSERLKIYQLYREFWQRQFRFLPNISFLDWTKDYKDEEGFCISEKLRPGDFHIGDFKPALFELEKHLEKIETKSI